jgi:hypothetical protein
MSAAPRRPARCRRTPADVVHDRPPLRVRRATAVRGHQAATDADDGVDVAVGAPRGVAREERHPHREDVGSDDRAVAGAGRAVADEAVPRVHLLAVGDPGGICRQTRVRVAAVLARSECVQTRLGRLGRRQRPPDRTLERHRSRRRHARHLVGIEGRRLAQEREHRHTCECVVDLRAGGGASQCEGQRSQPERALKPHWSPPVRRAGPRRRHFPRTLCGPPPHGRQAARHTRRTGRPKSCDRRRASGCAAAAAR